MHSDNDLKFSTKLKVFSHREKVHDEFIRISTESLPIRYDISVE